MSFCLVADDGEAQVVVAEAPNSKWNSLVAENFSLETDCKWQVCRREPSANGTQRVVIEMWKKGKKV